MIGLSELYMLLPNLPGPKGISVKWLAGFRISVYYHRVEILSNESKKQNLPHWIISYTVKLSALQPFSH